MSCSYQAALKALLAAELESVGLEPTAGEDSLYLVGPGHSQTSLSGGRIFGFLHEVLSKGGSSAPVDEGLETATADGNPCGTILGENLLITSLASSIDALCARYPIAIEEVERFDGGVASDLHRHRVEMSDQAAEQMDATLVHTRQTLLVALRALAKHPGLTVPTDEGDVVISGGRMHRGFLTDLSLWSAQDRTRGTFCHAKYASPLAVEMGTSALWRGVDIALAALERAASDPPPGWDRLAAETIYECANTERLLRSDRDCPVFRDALEAAEHLAIAAVERERHAADRYPADLLRPRFVMSRKAKAMRGIDVLGLFDDGNYRADPVVPHVMTSLPEQPETGVPRFRSQEISMHGDLMRDILLAEGSCGFDRRGNPAWFSEGGIRRAAYAALSRCFESRLASKHRPAEVDDALSP